MAGSQQRRTDKAQLRRREQIGAATSGSVVAPKRLVDQTYLAEQPRQWPIIA